LISALRGAWTEWQKAASPNRSKAPRRNDGAVFTEDQNTCANLGQVNISALSLFLSEKNCLFYVLAAYFYARKPSSPGATEVTPRIVSEWQVEWLM
jgi:hypothetical protein